MKNNPAFPLVHHRENLATRRNWISFCVLNRSHRNTDASLQHPGDEYNPSSISVLSAAVLLCHILSWSLALSTYCLKLTVVSSPKTNKFVLIEPKKKKIRVLPPCPAGLGFDGYLFNCSLFLFPFFADELFLSSLRFFLFLRLETENMWTNWASWFFKIPAHHAALSALTWIQNLLLLFSLFPPRWNTGECW